MKEKQAEWISRGLGLLCFAAGIAAGIPALAEAAGIAPWWRPLLFIAAWLLIGSDVLLRALGNITRGRIFDENFLMTIATVGAFCIGEFPEGAAVMLFYQIGEAFQAMAVRRSRSSITALLDLRPDEAVVRREGQLLRVGPGDVRPGEYIVVKPGEKIALDGVVEEGSSFLDVSAMTGEPAPRRADPGTEVLAGMINQSGLLTIRVSREAEESAVARILTMVKEAEDRKAPVENFITRFARYYTPAVVSAALVLAVLPPVVITFFSAGGAVENFPLVFAGWLRRALVFLVVSCPCALVVSIPLSFFGGIGAASKRGILVKGGNYLDALTKTGAAVFDKTGTLTRGTFSVSQIIPAPPYTEDAVLRYAALAETNSNHPIALSIRRAAGARSLVDGSAGDEIVSYSEIAGKGVRCLYRTDTLRAGSRALLEEEGIPCGDSAGCPDAAGPAGTVVYLAVNGEYAGRLVIADDIKPDSRTAIAALRRGGIKTVMLSGDSPPAAAAVAGELGLDEVHAGLLPWEKVDKLEELKKSVAPRKLVFTGDGINDAPVLAASDIGIAMGGLGSDAAIESADIVLMTDEPSKLLEAMAIARKTLAIVKENIVFALGVKAVLLVLGALGIASMWAAVFGDVGVTLIAVINAMRTLAERRRA
ncbi:MAG: heavy metal translocating P-type ATPase [Treponema sp.]|nr:heavy metal translocating P-type ATPase [Treponema sp.]